MYKRILVPTDGSQLSEKAAARAVDLAKPVGAEVIGLGVVPRYAGRTGTCPSWCCAERRYASTHP